MAASDSSTTGIEDILTDAAEIQIATINAGIEFWSQWVKQTTQLSKALEKKLAAVKKDPANASDILLEITEANRKQLRTLTELPAFVAKKYIAEVDRLQKKRSPTKKAPAKPVRRAKAKP